MRRNLFIILMVIFLFSLSTTVYADSYKVVNSPEENIDILNNMLTDAVIIWEGTETKSVYNNEIIITNSYVHTDMLKNNIHYIKVSSNNKSNIIIVEETININEYIMDTYYEFDENGDLYQICRGIDKYYIKNLTAEYSAVEEYDVNNIPEWVDNIYTSYEISDKIQTKYPEFLINEVEEITYDNTLYQIFYDNEEYHYFNTKTLEVTTSVYTKNTEKLLKNNKKVKFYEDEVSIYKYNDFYVVEKEDLLKEELKKMSFYDYRNTEEEMEYLIEKIGGKTKEEAFKLYKERHGAKKQKIDQTIKVENKKDENKVYKKINFKYEESFLELKKGKLYYSIIKDKIKYTFKISKEELEKAYKEKTIKKYVLDVTLYCKEALGAKYSQEKRTETPNYYDCSSLVYYAYKTVGVDLCDKDNYPPTAASEAKWLEEKHILNKVDETNIEKDDLNIGDLLFFSNKTNGRYMDITHVAMYIGDGKIIHASGVKKGVCEQEVYFNNIVAYGRVKNK